VDRLFICPGSTEAAILDAMLDRDDIELILTTHEGVTVSMADGLARATQRPAVAYLHANVGLTNGLSHLYAAQLGYSPVVVLTGLKPGSIQAHGGFTTASRMRDFVHQYVKMDWQSLSADAVLDDVNRAMRTSVAEPPGPVWVGLAQDIIGARTEAALPAVESYRFDSRTVAAPAAVARAAELLAAAQRPVLVAGSEVARSRAMTDLVKLSERLDAAVLHEDRRGLERPAFPTDHPNFRGQYVPDHPLVQEADLLLFLGARVFNEFEPPQGPAFRPGVRVIQSHTDVDHVARVHGVDVGLVGDQQLLLEALLDALPPSPGRGPLAPAMPTPVHRTAGSDAGKLQAPDVVDVITECLAGAALVGDATTAGGVLQRRAHQASEDDYFVSTSGSLGWGMGAALGIKMGMPERAVAAVLGDGVFQFGMPALWTAARYQIPVTYVVLNNQSYAAVGAALRRFQGRAVRRREFPGVDLAGPRLADISSAFGVPGRRVESLADLRESLADVRTAEGPTLIEVMTDPTDFGP
jgi:benzoylformate decarboxylase